MAIDDDLSEDRRADVVALFHSAEGGPAFPERLAGRALGLAARLAERGGEPGEGALRAGDAVGPYEVVAPLGAGGQGLVYRARHRHLGREVALKTPRREIAARLLREAKLAASLEHPRIVRVEHVEPEAPVPYMVLELCEGGSLADLLAGSPGGLTVAKALEVAEALLDALAYAHARGIIHCDLKPANVLFDREGEAKLADFGVGRVAAEEAAALAHSVTAAGATVARGGTPAYMAPEQEDPSRLAGAALDGRADLFAFGKLLFQMLTGASPTTVRPISRMRPEIDPRWDGFLFDLLEEERDDRYPSAEAALEAMREIVRTPPRARAAEPSMRVVTAVEPDEPLAWSVEVRGWFGKTYTIVDSRGLTIRVEKSRVHGPWHAPFEIDHRGEFRPVYTLRDAGRRRLAVAIPLKGLCRWGWHVALRGHPRVEIETLDWSGTVVACVGHTTVLRFRPRGMEAVNRRSLVGRLHPAVLAFLFFLYRRTNT